MEGAGIHIMSGGKGAAEVAVEAGGGSGVLLSITRLVLDVGSCAAFVPALRCVFLRRRHFESFIGVFQLVAALAYTITDCMGWATLLLVASDDWHRLSDIMSETYVCLIAVHLMGLRDEDHMTLLRYVAFALVWLAKLADGWGSIVFEVSRDHGAHTSRPMHGSTHPDLTTHRPTPKPPVHGPHWLYLHPRRARSA